MNDEEMAKCEALQEAIKAITEGGYPRPPDLEEDYEELPELLCHRAVDVFECMELIAGNDMDLLQLDTGVAYTAGEYYNMMPLVAEKYERGKHWFVLAWMLVAHELTHLDPCVQIHIRDPLGAALGLSLTVTLITYTCSTAM